MAVASADAPQFQWNNNGTQNNVSVSGASWATSSGETYNGYYQLQTGNTPVENIILTFVGKNTSNNSSNAPVVTPSGSIHTRKDGQNSTLNGFLIQQGGQANTGKPGLTLTTGTSTSAGIILGANGEGNLYLNFIEITANDFEMKDPNWGDSKKTQTRKMTLDLSQATTTEYSLVGNIIVDAGRAAAIYGENVFEATFAKGMKGNLTLRSNIANTNYNDIISKIVFLDGSSLVGNVNIEVGQTPGQVASISGSKAPYSGNNFIFKKDRASTTGGIKGTLTTTDGYTRLYFEDNIANTANTTFLLRGGILVFDNYKNVKEIDNTLSSTSITNNTLTFNPNSNSKFSGGSLVFSDFDKVLLGNDGSGTLTFEPEIVSGQDSNQTTYQNGSVRFIMGGGAQASSSSPIVKGNISATNASVVFALKDVSGETSSNPFADPNAEAPTKTYYVDGDITIENGGLSAFWDDTKGFYGKIATTSGHSLTLTGGLIGKNDAWFEKGAITSPIPTIQATSETSHLVFEDNITIGEVDDSGEKVSIKNHNANLMVIFKGNSNIITSNIKNTGGYNNSSVTNLLIFENGNNQILSEKIHFIDKYVKNIIVLNGETSKVGDNSKKTDLLIEFVMPNGRTYEWDGENAIVANSSKSNSLTFGEIKIHGNEGVSEKTVEKTLNIISLNQDKATNSLSANSIQTTYGNTIIGKNIIDGSGNFNTDFFSNNTSPFPISKNDFPMLKEDFATTFMNDEYTAKGSYTFGNQLNGDTIIADISGNNYINVESVTIYGNVKTTGRKSGRNGGKNYISANSGTNSITGDINASSGGSNTIVLGGTTNTITSITASSGGNNNITLSGSDTNKILKGGSGLISAHDASNSITATGKSLTIGDSGNRISIEAKGGGGTGSNTITAGILNAYIGTIKAGEKGWNGYTNTITADNGNINIQSLSTFIYNHNDQAQNITTNSITLKQGTLTIGSISSNGRHKRKSANEFFLGYGSNSVTATVNDNITTSGDGAQTNFTLSGDGTTLTLKGSTSQITTLTACQSATNGNTLTLDTATNKSVEASVATLANGDKLKVEFKGAEGKSTKLTLDTANARNLKSISVTSGTNNTLALGGTNTMTITDQVIVGGSKGIIFDLSSGSSINFARELQTDSSGITTFNLGGASNTITGTLTNNGTHNFNVSKTGDTTLKYGSGLVFSSGINNINFNANGNSTLNWQGTDGALKNITTSDTATTNINLADGAKATIASTSKITTSAGSTNINLNGTSTLTVDSIDTSDGNTAINFNGSTGTLTSGISTTGGSTNINIANGASGEIAGNVTTSSGSTNIVFASGSNASSLKLNKSSGAYAISTLTANGSDNKLELAQGKATISNKVSLAQGTGITFDLATDTELALSTGADSRLSAEESKGAITLTLQDNATATISGSATNITNLDFTGSSAQTLNVKNSSISFGTITANNTDGSNLKLDASANAVSATLHTITGDNLFVELAGTDNTKVATLNLNGGTLKNVKVSSGDASANIINFNSSTTTITNTIDSTSVASGKGLALNLEGGNLILENNLDTQTGSGGTVNVSIADSSTLSLKGNANKIASLSGNGKVDLAMADTTQQPVARNVSQDTSKIRKSLEIGDYTKGSSTTFALFAQGGDVAKSDRVIIKASSSNTAQDNTSATINVIGDKSIFGITLTDGVMVVDASANTETKTISIQGGESIVGGEKIKINLVQKEGEEGKYYIGKVQDLGTDEVIQQIASSALTVNYDLYLANFNSLNKRMGELRDNPYNQGVWARVFGGAMSNDFGAGSKTDYITAQAGYDYALSVGGNAKNYIGVAIAYGKSWTKGNSLSSSIVNGLDAVSLSKVNSNMVEVGIYNSYVADSGWYNDTIFKFDYIMSEFSLDTDPNNMSKTNNFAMVLSDEFGYRYKFGSEKSWYIDPQVEVGFGYFNQSDFNRAVYDKQGNSTDLSASQDSILTLRTRAGMSLGKKFSTQKGFASVYVGAFYEYDYIEGGNAQASGRTGGTITQLDKVESNGRAVVNVGSNIELTEGVRMYIDVEKSFGDKQRTFMQFNFGARYSFGEKTLSAQSKTNSAPLKIENQNSQKQSEQANSQEQNTSSKE